MQQFEKPLNEINLYNSSENPEILGNLIPEESFGLEKHELQDGFHVFKKIEEPYEIWFFNGAWYLYATIAEKNIPIIWPENVTKLYLRVDNPDATFRIVGLQAPIIADIDPSDGITNNPEDKSFVEGLGTPNYGFTGIGKEGPQGPAGPAGPQGPKGDSGEVSSGKFKWSNWMGQAPGFQAGNMEYGGASTYGEATKLTFHKEDADGVDQSTFLDQYLNAKSGQIKTILDANSGHHNVYQIVGASIDINGNYEFDVYNVSYDDIAVTTGSTTVYFVLVGAEGPKGDDGAAGPTGPAGPAGPAGADGNNAYTDSDVADWLNGNYNHHIIPSANAQYDLGNAEYKIRHLFLSDNSMYIGDKKLGMNPSKGLELKDGDDNSLWSHQETIDAVKANAEYSDKLPLFESIQDGKQSIDPHFGGGLVELDVSHRLFLDTTENCLKIYVAGVLYKIDLVQA